MRGLYLATMQDIFDAQDCSDPGIRDKLCLQYNTLVSSGFQMQYRCLKEKKEPNNLVRIARRLPLAHRKYHMYYDEIKTANFIYIRKPLLIDVGFIELLKIFKETNGRIRILLEIPTYPYYGEIKELRNLPLKGKDRRACSKLHHYVDRVVTYSRDAKIYGIPCIRISNAVNNKSNRDVGFEADPKSTTRALHVMACARFNFWHGYDRAIEGLKNYYAEGDGRQEVILDFVGDGPSVETYKKLVSSYHLKEHVVFHGMLQGNQLAEAFTICDIGLDSLGRHRAGVYYNSSLKGKEYCAHGLLIVSGVENELDYAADFPYYMRVPADESPLDFNRIVGFYEQVLKREESSTMLREAVMRYAREHFSMESAFAPVIEYIKLYASQT